MTIAWKTMFLAAAPLAIFVLMLGSGHGLESTARGEPAPDAIELPPGSFRYRASGDFTRDGRPSIPPIATIAIRRTLSVMRHQVTVADYQRCVEAKACQNIDTYAASDLPAVKASWQDARAYASWLSRKTGMLWRLPTDEEWAYAAASRFNDEVLPERFDGSDPGRRALAIYDRDAASEGFGKMILPIGSFGVNENGLLDLAGNVWEWTDTCLTHVTLNAESDVVATIVNCGVRVVEGQHRTYMADFIRDPRMGGCSIGAPPANLGFRLVRDDDPWRGLRVLLSRARMLVNTYM